MIVLLNPSIVDSHISAGARRNQSFTELVFLFTAEMFLIFAMFGEEDNFYLGYVPIIAFGVYIFVMFAMIFTNVVRNIRSGCRKYQIKRKYKKSRAKLQDRLQ